MVGLAVILVLGLVWPKGSRGWTIGIAYFAGAFLTPFISLLVGSFRGIDIVMLAYLLFGIGLIVWALLRRKTQRPPSEVRKPN